MSIEELFNNNYKEELVKTLQDLIKIPSVLDNYNPSNVYPFGKNIYDALDFMLKKGKEDGFDTLNCDNYAGHIEYGNKDGKLIGVLCHLDVVPVSVHWKHNPFGAEIIDGKMYGRGTEDDKGPSLAAYFALKMIKDQGIKLKNNIRMIFGCDEETGWRGVSHYFTKYPHPVEGFAPDASFPLIYGEKGRSTFDLGNCNLKDEDVLVSLNGGERYNVVLDEVTALVKKDITKEFMSFAKENNLTGKVEEVNNNYKLTLIGKPSHGAFPECGVNSGTYMCVFLKDYTSNGLIHLVADKFHLGYFLDKMNLDYDDYEMGKITCNIGVIDLTSSTSRVTLDLRIPTRYDTVNMTNKFKEIFDLYNVSITASTCKECHYVSPEDKLVKDLYASYVKYTNDTVNKPFTIGGGTYAGLMNKGVAFGVVMPGEAELAHQDDECISLESLYKATLIYYDAILKLGEQDA